MVQFLRRSCKMFRNLSLTGALISIKILNFGVFGFIFDVVFEILMKKASSSSYYFQKSLYDVDFMISNVFLIRIYADTIAMHCVRSGSNELAIGQFSKGPWARWPRAISPTG